MSENHPHDRGPERESLDGEPSARAMFVCGIGADVCNDLGIDLEAENPCQVNGAVVSMIVVLDPSAPIRDPKRAAAALDLVNLNLDYHLMRLKAVRDGEGAVLPCCAAGSEFLQVNLHGTTNPVLAGEFIESITIGRQQLDRVFGMWTGAAANIDLTTEL